jgi:hypothetical protein
VVASDIWMESKFGGNLCSRYSSAGFTYEQVNRSPCGVTERGGDGRNSGTECTWVIGRYLRRGGFFRHAGIIPTVIVQIPRSSPGSKSEGVRSNVRSFKE